MKTSEILKQYVDEIAKLDNMCPDFAASIIQHHVQVVKAINDGQQLTAKCNIWRSDIGNTLGMTASIKTRNIAHVDVDVDADDVITEVATQKDKHENASSNNHVKWSNLGMNAYEEAKNS